VAIKLRGRLMYEGAQRRVDVDKLSMSSVSSCLLALGKLASPAACQWRGCNKMTTLNTISMMLLQ